MSYLDRTNEVKKYLMLVIFAGIMIVVGQLVINLSYGISKYTESVIKTEGNITYTPIISDSTLNIVGVTFNLAGLLLLVVVMVMIIRTFIQVPKEMERAD